MFFLKIFVSIPEWDEIQKRLILSLLYYNKKGFKKVLVVITDGESTEPAETIKQAEKVHSDWRNIQVIAIGVAGANLTELEIIASTKEQVFFLDDFAAFEFVQVRIN